MKKLLSLVLIFVLVAGVMAGCGDKVDKKTAVMTVNGEEVTAEFFNFYLTQMKKNIAAQMNSTDVEIAWEDAELEGKKLIDIAREKAIDNIVSAVVVEQKAQETGVKLTSEEEKSVNSQISETITQKGSRANYEKWLEDQGLTEDIFKRFIRLEYLTAKLGQVYITDLSEADLLEYYNSNISRVKHILVSTVDQMQQPLSAAEVEAKKALADELLGRARSGEDFDALVAEYSEDPGSKSQPEGYYLGKGFIVGSQGQMVTEFEQMSLALEVGGISEPVETTYGYHIIKRYPNDPQVLEENKEQILQKAITEKYAIALEEWKTAATVEVKDEIINKL